MFLDLRMKNKFTQNTFLEFYPVNGSFGKKCKKLKTKGVFYYILYNMGAHNNILNSKCLTFVKHKGVFGVGASCGLAP